MTANQPATLRIIEFLLFSLFLFVTCFGQSSPRALLNHLQGSWSMTGAVLNKPVKYAAEGVWVLQSQFLSLHMRDVAVPPTYEASLFIGIDSSKNQFVAHWLDKFGGAGARVVALGPLSAEKIEIIYPYAEGRFRNLFRYDAPKDQWSLLIEAEDAEGKWSVFAQYAIMQKH
jgi:hypothetical protein